MVFEAFSISPSAMTVLQKQQPSRMAQEIVLLDYSHLVGLTVLYFDHLLTLGMEIELLWRRRTSFSAYWFFVNRYFGLFSTVAVSALPFVNGSEKACRHYSLFREIVLVVTQTIAGIIMIIRVYALYGKDRRVLCAALVAGSCVIGVSVFSFVGQHAVHIKVTGGCHYHLPKSTYVHDWLAGSWEGLFAFDTFIFLLTLYNAFNTWRRIAPSQNLYTLVVRDGGIMALANLANIATYYPVSPGSLTTFANCISVTMISRLILNLHEHAFAGLTSDMSTGARHDPLFGSANMSFTTSFSDPESDARTSMRPGST
ncbi:hypothetical protein R3P38DRAFT_2874099 [Favolaschia claudopus]|uniref:DUF6533 domain-containing protein n=1 Tax=Favolaschia claudopus TaxID=2862362 RepID=A0AAW0D4P2_9AGAR